MSIYVRDANGNRQKIAGVGLPGPAGKSAYQYAVEGGFSGTEEEFRAVVGVRSNPSLLDNGYFADPINQRGKMEYTGEGYTICRWKLAQNDTNFLKIENGFIHVHIGSFGAFGQFVTVLDINSKYTFSFLTNENELAYFTMQNLITTGSSFPIKIGNRTIQLYVYNTYVSNPKAENVTAFLLHIPAVDDAIDINFVAAKLELGPVQTLAHKEGDTWVLNDPPPDPALELAKCQRYYRKGMLRYRRNPDYPSLFDPTADIIPIPMRAGGVYTLTNLCNAHNNPLDATIQNIWVHPSGILFPTIEVIGTGVPYMISMDYEVSADL